MRLVCRIRQRQSGWPVKVRNEECQLSSSERQTSSGGRIVSPAGQGRYRQAARQRADSEVFLIHSLSESVIAPNRKATGHLSFSGAR